MGHFIQRILKVMFAKLSTFVTFIAFSNALSLRLAAPEVTSCLEGTENYVENISVNIQPWPVHVATGATLSIDGGLTILDAIVEGSQLKLDLSLVTALGNCPFLVFQSTDWKLDLVLIQFNAFWMMPWNWV